MNPNQALLALLPLYPTRQRLEAAVGDDPAKREKLDRLAVTLWRMFRATIIGCGAAWFVCVATFGWLMLSGVLLADEVATARRLLLVATELFGTVVLHNYPWPFRHQGRRWVRWAVLAVGVPSLLLFAAGFFGLL